MLFITQKQVTIAKILEKSMWDLMSYVYIIFLGYKASLLAHVQEKFIYLGIHITLFYPRQINLKNDVVYLKEISSAIMFKENKKEHILI